MIENSKKLLFRLFTAVALAAAGCSVSASGQIPCADDSSCPSDYPVCSAGKCIAGTPTAATIAIVGAEGHASADMLKGSVRLDVTARADTGISDVALASGSHSYKPATGSAPPLYLFDVPTTDFSDGDVSFTASVTAGDGTKVQSAAFTVHVDNTPPNVTSPSGGTPALNQAVGSSGTVLFLDFRISETATIDAVATTGSQKFQMGEIDSGTSGVHRVAFAVGNSTPTGLYTITLTVTDLAGNVRTISDSTSTPLHFNVTAPLNVSMSVAGHLDGLGNKIKINGIPAATIGDGVKAVVTLPSGVVFGSGFPKYKVIRPDGSSTTFSANGDGSGTYTIASGEQEGVFTFHADVQDSAGSAASVEQPFLVATSAPQVVSGAAGIALSINFIGPNQTALAFDFSTDATPASFVITVNGHAATAGTPTGNHYFYTYTMQASDLPGSPSAISRTISVKVADVLGNSSTVTKSVTVDNLAPTVSVAPSSNVAVAGTAATVNISFTVADTGAVGANPTVTVAPAAGVTTFPAALLSRTDHAGSSDFVYQYVVHGSDAEGGATVNVDAKDAALNDFSNSYAAVFQIDRTTPSLGSALVGTRTGVTPPTVAYQFFKAGSTVWAEVSTTDCHLAGVAAAVGYVSTSTSLPVTSPMTAQGSTGASGCASAATFAFSRAVAADEPNGVSTITFTGTDQAGNVGSLTATYLVDNVAPLFDQVASVFLPTTSFDGNATLTIAVSEPLKVLNLRLRNLTNGHDYASGDSFGGYTPTFTLDVTTPLPCAPCKYNLSNLKKVSTSDDWKFVILNATDAIDRAGNNVSGAPILSTNKITVDGTSASLALTSMVVSPLFLRSTVGTPGTVTFTGTSTRPLANVTMNTINLAAGGASSDASSCSFLGSNVNCTITASANEGARVAVTGQITDLNSNTAPYTAGSVYTVDNTAPAIASVALTGGAVVSGARTYSSQASFNTVTLGFTVGDCDSGSTVTVSATDSASNPVAFTGGSTGGTMGCATAQTFSYTHTISGDAQGVTQVRILVVDHAGNSSTSSISYVVDTNAPTVLGTPAWSSSLGNDGGAGALTFIVAVNEPISVSLTGAASDTFQLNDGTFTYRTGVTTNTMTPTFTLNGSSPCTLCMFTVSGLTKANASITYTPVLKLVDPVGNTTNATESGITYINDTVVPDFAAGIAAAPAVVGKNVRSGVVVVTGTSSKALKSVAFSSNETTPETASCTIDPATQTHVTCTLTINNATVTKKTVTVTLNPTDLAGNDKTGGTAAHYQTTYTLDNVGLVNTSPTATPSTAANNQVITISGSVTKTSSAAYTLASASIAVTTPASNGGSGSCTVTSAPNVTPGTYTCLLTVTDASATASDTATVTLTDAAGNQVQPTVNYSIDNRAPTAGTLTLTSSSIITGSAAPVQLNWTAMGGGANCTATNACVITSSTNPGLAKKVTSNGSGTYTTTASACVAGGDCLPNPTATTTYTLTVTAVNGTTASSSTTLTVAPTIPTFTTTEAVVTVSGSNNVTFNITVNGVNCNTAVCAVTGTDGTNVSLNGLGGSFTANQYTATGLLHLNAPLGGVTYTLSVTDVNAVSVTRTAFVDVVALPTFSGTFSTPSLTGGGAFTQLVFTMPAMNGAASATFKDNSNAAVQKPLTTTNYTSAEILAASGTTLNVKPPVTSASGSAPVNFTYTIQLSNSATTPGVAPLTTIFTAYPLPTVGSNLAAGAAMPTIIVGGTSTAYTLTLPTFANISGTTGTLSLVDVNNSNQKIINNATGTDFTSAELLAAGTGGTVTARLNTLATDNRTIGFQLIARNLASDAVNVTSNTLNLRVIPNTQVNMNAVRFGATATLLTSGPNSGKILIAGGASALVSGDCQSSTPVLTAEIYDPTTGTVTTPAHPMTVPRCQHTASIVGTNVYMIGGADSTAGDVYDMTAGDFKTTSLPTVVATKRTRHTANVVGSDIFLVGGATPTSVTTPLKQIEKFTPPNTLVSYTDPTSILTTARASHTATSFGGTKLLIVGGETADATVEIFDTTCAAAATAGCVSNGSDASNTAVRVAHSAVALSGGKILIAGGVDAGGNPLNTAQLYDSTAGAGSKFSSAGAMAGTHVRFPMIAFGTNKAAVFGGTGSAFDFVETFDAVGPSFTAYKVLNSSRSAATTTTATSSFAGANKEVWVVAGGTVGTAGSIETVVGP